MNAPYDHICGEKFAALADITFTPGVHIPHDHDHFIYSKTDYIQELATELRKIDELNKKGLAKRHVIITHNSDCVVSQEFADKVPDSVKHWFAQNCEANHEKFTALPIGLANSEWPHGDFKPIQQLIDTGELKQKKRIAFMATKLGTNLSDRMSAYNHFSQQSWCETHMNPIDRQSYLEGIWNSIFCVCPLGNGPDTCRLWEALYLGVIPITKDIPALRHFWDLPIVFVDDYKDVTKDFLKHSYDLISRSDWNKKQLDMKYWKEIISDSEFYLYP